MPHSAVKHLSTGASWIENRPWTSNGNRSHLEPSGLADRRGVDAERRTPQPDPGRTADVVIARRAMACEFSVSLPGTQRDAFEIGCAALDEVDRLERRLTVYDDESDVATLNRSAAERAVPLDEELRGAAAHGRPPPRRDGRRLRRRVGRARPGLGLPARPEARAVRRRARGGARGLGLAPRPARRRRPRVRPARRRAEPRGDRQGLRDRPRPRSPADAPRRSPPP